MTDILCNINDIEDPGSKGFSFDQTDHNKNIFLVKKNGKVYAYKNKCPHAGVNLEWRPDDFLDIEKTFIQCTVHGALFLIKSGECVGGPCNGNHLESVTINIDDAGNIALKE